MTKNFAKKSVFLLVALTVFLPANLALAVTISRIGDACVHNTTNSDCKIGGADLDCETSIKKGANGTYLNFCECATDSDCDAEYGKPSTGEWDCSDGAAYTYNLDYCYNTETKETKLPIEPNKNVSPEGKLVDAIFDSPATKAALLEEVKTFKPTVEIKIPGLEFSDLEKTIDTDGYIHIPWIGELIKTLYNFGLGTVTIVAVIMIIIQGVKIVVGGGEGKPEAYKKIGQIAIGLVIAWGSYAILYTINPALVQFKALRIKYVETIDMPEYAVVSVESRESRALPNSSPTDCSNGEKGVAPPFEDPHKRQTKYPKLEPPPPGITYLDAPRCCQIPIPSTPAYYPDLNIDHTLLGLLDCNNTNQTKNKKRDASSVKMVILHQGWGSPNTKDMIRMWSNDWIYGKIVTCKYSTKNKKYNYEACTKADQKFWIPPNSGSFPTGSHYSIAQDGKVEQLIDELFIVNHCCTENSISIGIDLEWRGPDSLHNTFSDIQYQNLAKLIMNLSKKYNFPINDGTVRGHCELGSHADPPTFRLNKLGELMDVQFNVQLHNKKIPGNANCSFIE